MADRKHDQHDQVRIGVIGAGRWAVHHHIPAVMAHPHACLVGLAEPDPTRRAAVAERYGASVFASADELIASGLANAVVISSPAAAHPAAAIAALESGLHVLVEKPMAIEPQDAWAMVEAARRHERHLVVGFTFQFASNAATARELIAGGAIGDVQLVEVSYASGMRHLYQAPGSDASDPLAHPAPGTFDSIGAAGGGQAASQASHAVGSMLATSGLAVRSVCAHVRNDGLELDLLDAALLEFSGEAIGTLTSTGNLGPEQQFHWHLRYYGTNGVLVHDLREDTIAVHRRDGGIERTEHPAAEPLYPAQAPMRCLIDLVLGSGRNPAPGELGAQTTDVIAALYRSAAAGGERSEIPVRVLDSEPVIQNTERVY